MRPQLPGDKVSAGAAEAMARFHSETVQEVVREVQGNEWVIVGMAGNVFVKKARRHLEGKGKQFKYLEYGSYLQEWKTRLAVKLWSGWPTFPQVFHRGVLIGGYDDLQKYLP